MTIDDYVERFCNAAPDRDVVRRELARFVEEAARLVCSSCRVFEVPILGSPDAPYYHEERLPGVNAVPRPKSVCRANELWKLLLEKRV